MVDRLDLVLDECIDRITLHRETVEDCVARYPEHAAELRRCLSVAAKVARGLAFSPGSAAKDLGRQKLQEELRDIEQADARRQARRNPSRSLFGRQPRWAIALVALALAIVGGGAGTVSVSRAATPVDPLYPVKLAAERVQLALSFSEAGKARLHLAYAERRAGEMSGLLNKGDTSRLEPAKKRLLENLEASTRIVNGLEDAQASAVLTSDIGSTASRALASLQAALQTAPEASSQAAQDVFRSSSDAYGVAIEATARRAPKRPVAATGTLQLRVTDPPPQGVAQLLVEIGSVEAHLAAGPESRWVTVTEDRQLFDLLRTAEIQKFLGEQEVDAGVYTKIRFQVVRATVVTNDGTETDAVVPSGFLTLARPFRVESGKTTVVLLDFNGARSLKNVGQHAYTLAPQVMVFVTEPGRQANQTGKEAGQKRDKERQEEQQHKTPGIEPGTKMELEGVIESLSADSIVVKGKRIAVGDSTATEDNVGIGSYVQVTLVVQPDGSLLATEVSLKEGQPREHKPTQPDGKDGQKQGRESEKRIETGAVSITGTINFIGPGNWKVGTQDILIDENTKVAGTPAVGVLAQVAARRQSDGKLLAANIIILEKPVPTERDEGNADKRPLRTAPSTTPTQSIKEPATTVGASNEPALQGVPGLPRPTKLPGSIPP